VAETKSDESEDLSDYQSEMAVHELIIADRHAEALPLLKPLCERHSGYAYLVLGGFYETGTEVPVDMQEALRCYRKATEVGYERAYLWLGNLLERVGDTNGARVVYEAGAELDQLPCKYWLGCMMIRGGSEAMDATRGRAWLQTAADEGHIGARAQLIGMDMHASGTIGAKVVAGFKALMLLVATVREAMRDPESDRLS
jgi:TPR repeat protein